MRRDITELPFEELQYKFQTLKETIEVKTANVSAVNWFVDKFNIAASWKWLGPQLLSYLGSYKLPAKRDGLYDCNDYLSLNINSDRDLGIFRMITKVPRSSLMTKQTLPEHLPVCALVPIYMAAQKKMNDVPFSLWDKSSIGSIVDGELATALRLEPMEDMPSNAELLEIRAKGLKYISKSRKNLGAEKSYNPETYHQLHNIKDTPIAQLPRFARVMLCQIWCAHPVNRSKYMILDPWNWDNIPDPLIASRPTVQKTTTQQWEDM